MAAPSFSFGSLLAGVLILTAPLPIPLLGPALVLPWVFKGASL
jgi:hypothetical protein